MQSSVGYEKIYQTIEEKYERSTGGTVIRISYKGTKEVLYYKVDDVQKINCRECLSHNWEKLCIQRNDKYIIEVQRDSNTLIPDNLKIKPRRCKENKNCDSIYYTRKKVLLCDLKI